MTHFRGFQCLDPRRKPRSSRSSRSIRDLRSRNPRNHGFWGTPYLGVLSGYRSVGWEITKNPRPTGSRYFMVLAGGAQKGSKSGPKRGISSNLPRARAEIHVIILLESAGDRGFSFRPNFGIEKPASKFPVFCRFLAKNGPKMVQNGIYTSLLGVPLLDHF